MTSRLTFGVVDYVVFGLTLLFSALIGVLFRFTGGRQKTTEEFFLGSKDMSVIPVAFSIMTSYFSATGMLGLSSETYLYGFQLAYKSVLCFITTPIVTYVYHTVFYNLGMTTVNEYLNRRFGKYARGSATIVYVLQVMLYMAVSLYAPSLTLSIVSGISLWASILLVGIVCTFYCILGGIKAVIWTDFFQVVLMFTTVIVVIVKGSLDVGGMGEMWRIANDGGRINFSSFKFDVTDRYGFWSLMIGGIFFQLSINSVNQTQVQRIMTLGSLKKSRQANWATQPLIVSFLVGLCLCGIVIYSNMGSCDPLLRSNETGVTKSDQLLPYFIMQSLGNYPGLPGLCVSGIFSASISSLSSGINSLTAVTLEDFIRPYCCVGKLTESRAAFVTKILVLTYGILSMLLSYMVGQMGVLVQASVTIFGVLGGPVLGLFTLGMLFVRPNEKGAVVGLIVSSAFFLWIGFGNNISKIYGTRLPQTTKGCPNITSILGNSTFSVSENITSTASTYITDRYIFPLYKISFWWFSVFSCLLTIIIGYFVSIVTGPNQSVDEELLSPLARWLYGYSSRKEEYIKLKHKERDLVGAETRCRTSNSRDVTPEIEILLQKEGVEHNV